MRNCLPSIRTLCQKYTDLSAEDIQIISAQTNMLQQMADLAQANIFIDCPSKGQKAIVVAEAVPATIESLYSESVVGKFAYESLEPAVFLTHQTGKPATRQRAVNQEGKFVKQSVIPINNETGATIGSLIMEQDISDQVEHEHRLDELSDTTEQLSEILIGLTEIDPLISDMIQESLFLLNADGVITYANANAVNLVAELTSTGVVLKTRMMEHFPFLKYNELPEKDVSIREMTVGEKVLEIKRIMIREHHELSGILYIFRDLTEIRDMENELMAKSAVIQEIHHRVKNNLQTVASLLRLQMKHGVPEEVQDSFRESLNRIASIATVHDELLIDSSLDHIEMVQLLQHIARMVIQNKPIMETEVTIKVFGGPVYLRSEKATSLALVVNELLQNGLKHAFKNRKCGWIRVLLMETASDFTVNVQDDGERQAPLHGSSLGLKIVDTIVTHHLEGQFSIEKGDDGTTASVTFPKRGMDAG